MANLQSEAEENLYDNIGSIQNRGEDRRFWELVQMGEKPDIDFLKLDEAGRKTYVPYFSPQRGDRLMSLKDSFIREIRNNLLLDGVDKASLINNYLKDANRYRDHYQNEYDTSLNTRNVEHYKLSGNYQQVWILNGIINMLEECKRNLPNRNSKIEKFKSWKEFIKPELHDYLSIIESKIEDKISKWKQGKMKIEGAAFCQLLFDRKYFVAGSTKRVTVNKFALNRYGLDIENQLLSKFDTDRNKHKTLLNKYFK